MVVRVESKNGVVGVGSNPVVKVVGVGVVVRAAPVTVASAGKSSAPRVESLQNSSRLPPDSSNSCHDS